MTIDLASARRRIAAGRMIQSISVWVLMAFLVRIISMDGWNIGHIAVITGVKTEVSK